MHYSKTLYMDNTSTNPIDSEILKTYTMLLEKYYANSGAIHTLGREVNRLHEKSRSDILELLNLKNYKLVFTAGATEANNMAIKSVAMANMHKGKHLITSTVEHPSVMNSFKFLEEFLDFEVSYIGVHEDGSLKMEDLKRELRDDTILVSIMNVNNEVGTIINNEWAKYVKKHSSALTHSDMVQALGNIPLDFEAVDMASFSAHKINGVKGSGFLVFKEHIKMIPILSGGDQEMNLRAGTENAPANIVLAKTVRLALEKQESKQAYIKELRDYLFMKLDLIDGVTINSSRDNNVYNIVNMSAKGVGSQIMLNALCEYNMHVSAGSTCQSDIHKGSRVLKEMNVSHDNQQTRIRVSLNTDLVEEDIDTFTEALKEIIEKYAI